MNRPKQRCQKFLHQFSDGTQAVAKFKENGSVALLKWSRPLNAGILFEYLRWRDTTLQKVGTNKRRVWADIWPS